MTTIEKQKALINRTLRAMWSQPGNNIAIRSYRECVELHRLQDAAGVPRSDITGFVVK